MLPPISQRILWLISPILLIGIFNGFYKDFLYKEFPLLFWLADSLHFFILPTAILFYLYHCYAIKPSDYGFRIRNIFLDWLEWLLWIAITTIIFLYGYKYLSQFLFVLLNAESGDFDYSEAVPQSFLLKVLSVFYFAITAALVEEIFNRALPWLALSKLGKSVKIKFIYVMMTAVVFGLLHWENGLHEFWATTILGMVAAIIYLRIQTIWPLVIAHFITDCVVFW